MKKAICAVAFMLICCMASSQNNLLITDSLARKCLRGGAVYGGKLHLAATPAYNQLSEQVKKDMLAPISKALNGLDIIVYLSRTERELWSAGKWELHLVEAWNNDSLMIETYRPLELKRNGESRWFYTIGGTFSGTKNHNSGAINLRGGSYLFQNKADISLASNLGYINDTDTSQITADIGLDLRYYLPWRIAKVRIVPYAGGGIAWALAPSSYCEIRIIGGACWFLGSFGIDLGIQYGIKSHFAATLGLTFRPKL